MESTTPVGLRLSELDMLDGGAQITNSHAGGSGY